MSGGTALSGSGVLMRAQERVVGAQRTLGALERKDAKGQSARETSRAGARKVVLRVMSSSCCRSRSEPAIPPRCAACRLFVLLFFP